MPKINIGKAWVYFVIAVFGIGFVIIIGGIVIEPMHTTAGMLQSRQHACDKRHQQQLDSMQQIIKALDWKVDSLQVQILLKEDGAGN